MANKRKLVEAVAYMRTSSATNVGVDKDSEARQRRAIGGYAKRAGLVIVDWFTDDGVKGADAIEGRPGFARLLDRIEGNGVRTVVVEDASRFARELVTQELGILALIKRQVRVVTAEGDDLTDDSDPSRTMMRQIAGSFHQYEKARLVSKLKVARDAKKAVTGKCGGRKTYMERDPELVDAARALSAQRPRLSFAKIAAKLAEQGYEIAAKHDKDDGHIIRKAHPYPAMSVRNMLAA